MKNKIIQLLLISGVFAFTGCESFLEETNYSNTTDQTYLVSEKQYEELVYSAYAGIRDVYRQYDLALLGVDWSTRPGRVEGEDDLNDYVNLNAFNGECASFWSYSYGEIQNCNMVITRSGEIADISDATKTKRNAEVKAIRALMYFNLVQHFGGVPIVTDETRSPKTDYVRDTEENVYKFIISDLEAAIPALPLQAEVFGRVSKGMAQHLLSKVYLTRGYKSYAAADDFSKAAALAKTVIDSGVYSLLSSFASVMDENNQENNEVIFSVQYTTDNSFNGIGNDKHRLYKFSYDNYPGMDRTPDYGRSDNRFQPTAYFYTLFSEIDSRQAATLRRAITAVKAASGFEIGDTVVYFPKVAWSEAQKAAVNYYVFNPDEYTITTGITSSQYPMFRKFDDLKAPYADDNGTRDTYVFRLAETYLIASEAYLKAGDQTNALKYINDVRMRAAVAGEANNMKLSTVTIDKILDERILELSGETDSWADLKRTGKLIERVKLFNPHAAAKNVIAEYHLLRPIPQSEIDLTERSLTQNPGY